MKLNCQHIDPETQLPCGKPLPYARGRAPRFCLIHVSPRNRARRLRVTQQLATKQELARQAIDDYASSCKVDPKAWRASAPELLAIGLSIVDDPRSAAGLVGLEDLTDQELASAVIRARTDHKALGEGQSAAVGELIHQVLILAILRLRTSLTSLPATQAASTSKALAQCAQLMRATTGPAYSQLSIVVLDANGQPVDMSKRAA